MAFVFSTISSFIVGCYYGFLRRIESRMHFSGFIRLILAHGVGLCNSVTASGAEFRKTESARRWARMWTSDAVIRVISMNWHFLICDEGRQWYTIRTWKFGMKTFDVFIIMCFAAYDWTTRRQSRYTFIMMFKWTIVVWSDRWRGEFCLRMKRRRQQILQETRVMRWRKLIWNKLGLSSVPTRSQVLLE